MGNPSSYGQWLEGRREGAQVAVMRMLCLENKVDHEGRESILRTRDQYEINVRRRSYDLALSHAASPCLHSSRTASRTGGVC